MTDSRLAHHVRLAAPGANAPGVRPPLLVLLHGVGSNERSMARLTEFFDGRCIVLSVRSPLVIGPDAYAWFHVTFTATGPVIAAEEAEAGWKTLAAFVDAAVERYGADPARVYLAGFSQGGIMALATLLTAPEKIAGAAVMSGRLLPEVLPHMASAAALAGRLVLIVHGADDEKLGVHLARWAREQLAQTRVALTYVELPMHHTISETSLAQVTTWLTEALDAM